MKKLLLLLVISLLFFGCGEDTTQTEAPPAANPVKPDGSGGYTLSGSLAITTTKPTQYTVATLPSGLGAGDAGLIAWVTDGDSTTDCTTGGGSDVVQCRWSGTAWANAGDGTAAGSAEVQDEAFTEATASGDTTHTMSQDKVFDYTRAMPVTSEAELTAALAGSSEAIDIIGTVTLTANRTLNKPVYVSDGGSIDLDGNTLTISSDFSAGKYEIFADTAGTGDITYPVALIQDVRLIWFPTSAMCAAAVGRGATVWIDGQVDIDTKGKLDFDRAVWIRGATAIEKIGGSIYGAELTSTQNDYVIEFSPASVTQGARVSDIVINHTSTTHASIYLTNMVHSIIEKNVIVNTYRGIEYGAEAYFAYARDNIITGFSDIGIYVSSSANGSEYIFEDNHLSTTNASAVAGLKTERRGTRVIRGEYACDSTSGIGVWFYNASYSSLDSVFVEATPTGVLINGSAATSFVYINKLRTTGTTDSVIKFGAYAYDCVAYDPQIQAVTSGNIIEWADSAAVKRNGVYAPSNLLLSGSYSIEVGASAVQSFIYCTTPRVTMSGIVSATNLKVYNINGVGYETANAETPTDARWNVGDIVEFVDSGDASGDGFYLKTASSTWLGLDAAGSGSGLDADLWDGYDLPADPGADRYLMWDDSETGDEVVWGNPTGSGDITGVLGDATGDVPVLFQAWTAFSTADATPNVSTATTFRTVDTTTITDFDGTPVDGQFLYTYCGAATVFDFTSSGLEAWNRTSDLTCTAGQILAWKYRDTQWYCQNAPDEFETLSTSGIVVNNSGSPLSRSVAGAGLAVASNGDGTAGNPTITVTAENAAGINTGTATNEAVTADALAGSKYGKFCYSLRAVEPGTSLAVADGGDYLTIGVDQNGWNLVSVEGGVYTVSTSGTPTFQIYNVTDSQDMLSTALTIDANETHSSTAATAAAINTSYDDVSTGDRIRLDTDVAGTGTEGGDVLVCFQLP